MLYFGILWQEFCNCNFPLGQVHCAYLTNKEAEGTRDGPTHQLVPEGSRSNPSSGLHLGPEEFQNHSYQVTLAISCSGSPPKLALRYDHEQVALGLSAKGGTDLGPAGFLAREGLLGGSWVV